MHFIELIFGISPDLDSGALELVVLGGIATVLALLVARRVRRRERSVVKPG